MPEQSQESQNNFNNGQIPDVGYELFDLPEIGGSANILRVSSGDSASKIRKIYVVPEAFVTENADSVEERLGALASAGVKVRRPEDIEPSDELEETMGLLVGTDPISLLSTMKQLGHGTKEVADAQKALASGEKSDLLDSLGVLSRISELQEKSYSSEEDNLLAKVYKDVFRVDANRLSIVTDLAEQGQDIRSLRIIANRLSSGVSTEMLERSVLDPNKLQQEVNKVWDECIALAFKHNVDLLHNGVHTEIYKVGDVVVPVPAISSTSYEARDSSLGYVDATSGHTLAEMYMSELSEYPKIKDLDKIVFNQSLIGLIRGLGLEFSSGKTLERRCVTVVGDNGEPVIVLKKPLYDNQKKMNDDELSESLRKIGIASRVPGETTAQDKPKEASSNFEDKLTGVKVTANEVILDGPEAFVDTGMVGVLAGASGRETEGKELNWFYGKSGWHGAISKAVGLNNERIEISIGGKQFRAIGRYQWDPIDGVSKHSIGMHIEGNYDEFMAVQKELRELMLASGEEFQEVMLGKLGGQVEMPKLYATFSGGKGGPLRVDIN